VLRISSATDRCTGSADARAEADAFAAAALAAGASPANEPMDHGFMYGRSFNDPDGHLWEVVWMSPEAIEQGPADVAPTAA
jgi:predicted lactoylglutathione lyase